MSKEIDNRVVEMRFENEQFEKGCKQSINTLEKLEQSLELKNASKGLEKLEKTISSFSLRGIEKSLDTVSSKFTTLGIVGVTALQNITNKVVDAGIKLTKSLSVDQLTSGLTKYEQKTANVQTLMNATGKSMSEIEKYLDQLMWYSDETSYGFTDMTSALATMASSGGKIEKLIPMIEGIANATAFAGKGASEFTRVMYNLNQSYSAGYLSLMDWKSVSLAGVDSKQLKQTLIDTAVALGKIEKGEVTLSNFTTTLADKWADTEVMEKGFAKFAELTEAAYKAVDAGKYDTAAEAIEALSSQYSNIASESFKAAQTAKTFNEAIDATKDAVSSNWMKIYNIIFGNFEEAKDLWTEFTEMLWETFAQPFDPLIEVLEEWKKLGGRNEMIEGFRNLYKAYQSVASAISQVTKNLFGDLDSKKLLKFTKGFKDFTKSLILSNEESFRFGVILKKVFSQFSKFGYIIKEVTSGLGSVLRDVGNVIYNFIWQAGFASISDGIVNLYEAIKSFLRPIKEAFENVFGDINISNFLANIADKFRDFTKTLKLSESQAKKVTKTFVKLFTVLRNGLSIIKNILSLAKKVIGFLFEDLGGPLGKLFDLFLDVLSTITKTIAENKILEKTLNILSTAIKIVLDVVTALFDALLDSDLIKNPIDILTKAFGKLLDFLELVIDKVKEFFAAFTNKKNGGEGDNFFTWLFGILEKIYGYLDGFADKIVVSIQNIGKALNTAFHNGDMDKALDMFTKFAKAILLLDFGKFIKNLKKNIGRKGIRGILAAAGDFIDTLGSKINKLGKETKVSSILKIAEAIGILAASVWLLSTIKLGDLAKATGALIVFSIVLTEVFKSITHTLNNFPNTRGMGKALTGLLAFAISLGVIASAMKKVGEMDLEDYFLGLGAVLLFIAELFTIMKDVQVNSGDDFKKACFGLIGISLSVYLLMSSLQSIGKMDPYELFQGWIGVVLMLGTLAAFIDQVGGSVKTASGEKRHFIKMALALLVISLSLKMLFDTLKNIGSMDPYEMLQGLGTIILLLGTLAALMETGKMANAGKGSWGIGVAILGIAVAMNIFIKAMEKLSEMKWKDFIKGWARLTAILLSIGLTFRLIGSNGKYLWEVTFALIGIISAVKAFTEVITTLSELSLGGLIKGMLSVIIMLGLLVGTFYALHKIIDVFGKGIIKDSLSLAVLAISISLIASSIKSLSKIPFKDLITPMLGMIFLIGALGGVMYALGKANKSSAKASLSMLAVAGSLAIIAGVILVLKNYSWSELITPMLGMIGVLVSMMFLMKTFRRGSQNMLQGAAAFVVIAASLGLLALALYPISKMDWSSLLVIFAGLAGVVISIMTTMTSLFTATKGLRNLSKKLILGGTAFAIVAAGLSLIALAMVPLTQNDWKSLTVSFAGLIGLVVVISALMKTFNTESSKMLLGAAAFAIITASLSMLALAISVLAQNNWKDLIAPMAGLAILLAEIAAVLVIVSKVGGVGAILAATSIAIISVALIGLAASLKILEGVSWSTIGQMAVVLGAVSVVLGGLAAIMMIPGFGLLFAAGLIAVAGSFLTFGAALLVTSVAIQVLSKYLEPFATAFTNTCVIISDNADKIVDAITVMISGIAIAIANGITAFAVTLAENYGTLTDASVTLFMGIVDGYSKIIPKIAEAVVTTITTISTTLSENMPELIESLRELLTDGINAIAESIGEGELGEALGNLTKAMFKGMFTGLGGFLSGLFSKDEIQNTVELPEGTKLVDTSKLKEEASTQGSTDGDEVSSEYANSFAESFKNMDITALLNGSSLGMDNMGLQGVTEFVNGFSENFKMSQITGIITNEENTAEMQSAGKKTGTTFIAGVTNYLTGSSGVASIANTIKAILTNEDSASIYTSIGTTIGNSIISGIKNAMAANPVTISPVVNASQSYSGILGGTISHSYEPELAHAAPKTYNFNITGGYSVTSNGSVVADVHQTNRDITEAIKSAWIREARR